MDTDHVGHTGCRRERIYIILSHKELTQQVFDPKILFKLIVDAIQSSIRTRPRDYFVSSRREIHLAASDLAIRRGLRMKKVPWHE